MSRSLFLKFLLLAFCLVASELRAQTLRPGASAPAKQSTAPDIGIRTIDIDDGGRTLGLIWHASVVPGDELLIIKKFNKEYRITYYDRYRFLGITAGSAEFEGRTAIQEDGQSSSKEAKDMSRTIHVERRGDGLFYFVPEDLKTIGVFKLQHDDRSPGEYSVTFDRRQRP